MRRHQSTLHQYSHWLSQMYWKKLLLKLYKCMKSGKPDINTLRPRQNGRHFADDTFNRIFVNENVGISINISLKFDPKGQINNIPALVQIMAWRRPGDKPLSGPVMVSLLTHICVTRPQWVNIECNMKGYGVFCLMRMLATFALMPCQWSFWIWAQPMKNAVAM